MTDRAGWKSGGNRIRPAVICSVSVWVNWRAPFRMSTRLLSFDIGFSFQTSCSQLAIQPLVRIAGRIGHNNAQERGASSGGLFHFIVGKLASTPSGEYPVVVLVRHTFLLSVPDLFTRYSGPGGPVY
jgi:hypothetical protein